MSCFLWKFYLEDDVESFRRLLAEANYSNRPHGQRGTSTGNAGGGGNTPVLASSLGSPGATFSHSFKTNQKHRKTTAWSTASTGIKGESNWSNLTVTRADINLKDRNGLTLLHHAASSTSKTAVGFATALLDHTLADLYIQDLESGWTALHRALYFGNITTARAIMDRDRKDALGHNGMGSNLNAGGLIRIKDREGNSPFDLLNATVADRRLNNRSLARARLEEDEEDRERDSANGDYWDADGSLHKSMLLASYTCAESAEVFTFGSNKNLNLGFGDEDDRQFPERVTLKRPDRLLYRFYYERATRGVIIGNEPDHDAFPSPDLRLHKPTNQLPVLIQNRPLVIQDVVVSKLHTAVCTTDPEANLYTCGFGPGGRLGTGDETTRFTFACIEGGGLGGKKIVNVGLGQNHTLATTRDGELFSWGTNTFGQLGYTLPGPNIKDDEPVQAVPRQLFGTLKRQWVMGAAASRIHSAVFTPLSLYTFGKNEGQLGLVDSDARSLECQSTPRRVAASLFSSPIHMVSAIERATICLLNNHDVWVFANFGYAKMSFPTDGLSNCFLPIVYMTRYDKRPNHIAKITSGGDTICAMSRMGDVYTVSVGQGLESSLAAASTTNPTKIRNALSPPQQIWSMRKGHMAVRDVDVGQDGSVIICTASGSVWRRVKRAKIKDASASRSGDYKAKDYKFSRVPGLTRATAVRSNTFGAYAALRNDCDITRTQMTVSDQSLWTDVVDLLSFHDFEVEETSDSEDMTPRFWTPALPRDHFDTVKRAVLTCKDIEAELKALFDRKTFSGELSTNVLVSTTVSEVQIPVHQFMLCGRSAVIRKAFRDLQRSGESFVPELANLSKKDDGTVQFQFHGLDFLTILNFVRYVYGDSVVDVWQYTRYAPQSAFRYRQIRTELIKLASRLELCQLEIAARDHGPRPTLDKDMGAAMLDPTFFDDGDAIVELSEGETKVHSALMCRRCPFFEGLFRGRAAGRWLSLRRDTTIESTAVIRIDLKHVEPAIFDFVLRYLYSDAGEELFDEVVCSDLDEFLDLVTEVLSVANELMLDRLSEICQKQLGHFVSTRNVCQLLNAVAPCSVTGFKDVCLEYLCLNLEGMLENQLLDDLDEDMLLELDQVVRQNQLACLPFAKSGRAEDQLQQRFPDLAEARDRERQAKIDSVMIRARINEADGRLPSSKGKHNNPGLPPVSSTQVKSRRRASKDNSGTNPSPLLKSKGSVTDLMFDMDDDDGSPNLGRDGNNKNSSPMLRSSPYSGPTSPRMEVIEDVDLGTSAPRDPMAMDISSVVSQSTTPGSASGPSLDNAHARRSKTDDSPPLPDQVWGKSPLPSTKLSMKAIIEQASPSRTSHLSASLSTQRKATTKASPNAGAKLSQRERKKQQHQPGQARSPSSPTLSRSGPGEAKPSSPWQSHSSESKVSLKEVFDAEQRAPKSHLQNPVRTSSIPPISLASPTSNTPSPHAQSKEASKTSHLQAARSPTLSPHAKPTVAQSKTPRPAPSQFQTPSKTPARSTPPRSSSSNVEPAIQLSMADIISQQQTEQATLKQAVAKRSLHDIQQEQEFMEWWDAESRKARHDEESGPAASARRKAGGGDGGAEKNGRGGRSGGNKRRRGRGGAGGAGDQPRTKAASPAEGGPRSGAGGEQNESHDRGRGRGKDAARA